MRISDEKNSVWCTNISNSVLQVLIDVERGFCGIRSYLKAISFGIVTRSRTESIDLRNVYIFLIGAIVVDIQSIPAVKVVGTYYQ